MTSSSTSALTSNLPRRVLRAAIAGAIIVALWQLAITAFGLEPYILPTPARVAATLVRDAGYLGTNALITLAEILLGLVLGGGMGVATALAVSLFPAAGAVLLPVMVASQALPVFAIAPLLVIWFGYGLASKVVMAMLIIFFPVASSFLDGLRRTDQGLLDIARLNGASTFRTLMLIRLPSALPGLASGLRVAAAVAPIGAVVGEWVGASGGLGYVMLQANARVQTDRVFAALFILALAAILVRALVEWVTRAMVPWAAER